MRSVAAPRNLAPHIAAAVNNDLSTGANFRSLSTTMLALTLTTFGGGTIASAYAYDSLAPTLVAVVSLLLSVMILSLCGLAKPLLIQAFVQVFCVCWLWASIAAVFTVSHEDFSDAIYFYDEVTGNAGTWPELVDTLLGTENGGAIVLWRVYYNLFASLGLPDAPYIGVTLNVCLVAATCVIGTQIVHSVFGADVNRIRLFTTLYSFCGMFWLYAAIHIRDAAVLFTTSLATLAWVRYLDRRTVRHGIFLALITIALLQVFSLLRREFFYVPIAMACAGTAAFGMATQRGSKLTAILILSTAVAVVAQARWSLTLQDEAVELADINRHGYEDLSRVESRSDSLGSSLVLSQPLPIRLVLGSTYVLIFPIPCWIGFQTESAYHLLKSLHVLFMYALLPLVALSLWHLWRHPRLRTPQTLFLVFTPTGFLLSVSYTSLETRHFGAFLPSLLVLALLPDLSCSATLRTYRRLLTVFVLCMAGIHLMWFIMKGGF